MSKEEYRNRSVSSETLKTQDLAERFLSVLEDLNPKAKVSFALPESWDSDEAQDAFEELCQLLEDNEPGGCYFGTHPGDAAEFGFWSHD